jgi:glycosyltransferase involved in cell wall biosynthesis
MPEMYALGDIFVHPTKGQGWGMVVNEALGAGLPMVASHASGAAKQLIIDGYNGFLFDPTNREEMYNGMRFFAEHPDRIHEFANNAYTSGQELSVEVGAKNFVKLIESIMTNYQ